MSGTSRNQKSQGSNISMVRFTRLILGVQLAYFLGAQVGALVILGEQLS